MPVCLNKTFVGLLLMIDVFWSAGEYHTEKLHKLREELRKKDAHAMVVTMLDEIAWLFNMRGSDIDYNPGESIKPSANLHITIRLLTDYSAW